jgi:hypothetical protein
VTCVRAVAAAAGAGGRLSSNASIIKAVPDQGRDTRNRVQTGLPV